MNTCIKIEIIKINKKVKSVKVIIDQLERRKKKVRNPLPPQPLTAWRERRMKQIKKRQRKKSTQKFIFRRSPLYLGGKYETRNKLGMTKQNYSETPLPPQPLTDWREIRNKNQIKNKNKKEKTTQKPPFRHSPSPLGRQGLVICPEVPNDSVQLLQRKPVALSRRQARVDAAAGSDERFAPEAEAKVLVRISLLRKEI